MKGGCGRGRGEFGAGGGWLWTPKIDTGVAAGTSPHPRSSQAVSTASDWSDVLNLDSVSFIDWE